MNAVSVLLTSCLLGAAGAPLPAQDEAAVPRRAYLLRTEQEAEAPSRIGVLLGEVDEALAAHLELGGRPALMLVEILEDEAAAKAGLRKFDVILRINGEEPSQERLREAVRSAQPGERIRLLVRRGGDEHVVEVEPERHDAIAFDVTEDGEGGIEGRFLRLPTTYNYPEGFRAGVRAMLRPDLDQVLERVRAQLETLAEQHEDIDVEDIMEQLESVRGPLRLAVEPRAPNLGMFYSRDRMAPELFLLTQTPSRSRNYTPFLFSPRARGVDPEREEGEATERVTDAEEPAAAPDSLESRLARLESRLDRIESLLEKLADR